MGVASPSIYVRVLFRCTPDAEIMLSVDWGSDCPAVAGFVAGGVLLWHTRGEDLISLLDGSRPVSILPILWQIVVVVKVA